MHRAVLVVLFVVASACHSPRSREPDLASIYEQAALDEVRNPVIVIHGILGARLEERSTGKVVWGAFTDEGIDPRTPDGVRAVALDPSVIPASATAYDPQRCDVFPTGPLERLKLSFLYQVLSVDVYANIIQSLGAGGFTDQVYAERDAVHYADDHYTCFSFFYDWRRDNVENAIRLGEFMTEKRVEIQKNATAKVQRLRAAGDPSSLRDAERIEAWLERGYRFDIVAHSMGGLVARYFLRFGAQDLPPNGGVPEVTWAGARDIDRLLLIGTPSLGSVFACVRLTQGFQPAPFFPNYDPVTLGTMPAIYQLLPRTRHGTVVDGFGNRVDVDLLSPALWAENEWGILNPAYDETLSWVLPDRSREERRAIAARYQRWCLERAEQFHAALDQSTTRPCPARLTLFAADTEPTLTHARLQHGSSPGAKPWLSFESPMLVGNGDGTVPRYSAVGDERFGETERRRLQTAIPWHSITFLPDDHIGLTQNPIFTNNMLFQLLEEPIRPR